MVTPGSGRVAVIFAAVLVVVPRFKNY